MANNPQPIPLELADVCGVQPAVKVELAAKILGVGRTTVYALMDAGHLDYLRYPGVRASRVAVSELQRFMESCRGTGPEQH